MNPSRRIVCISAVIFTTACSGGQSERVATAAIDRLHEQMALGQYELIWSSMDENFRRTGALQRKDLDSIRNDLGTARHFWGRRGQIQLGYYFPNVLVELEGDGEFSKGWAHERFEWMIQGERAILRNYSIGKKYAQPGPSPLSPAVSTPVY